MFYETISNDLIEAVWNFAEMYKVVISCGQIYILTQISWYSLQYADTS